MEPEELMRIARVRNSIDALWYAPYRYHTLPTQTQLLKHSIILMAHIYIMCDTVVCSRVGALIYPDSIIHVYRKSEELGLAVKVTR
jgi:hypothetical protein